jgi:polyhydroxybutyrate depolymerase
VNNEWNAHFDLAGSSVSLTGQRSRLPQNDVQVLKTLTEDLGVDFNIDRHRMYVAGFSNGGFMTLRMTCSASDTFAGFAEVAAALYIEMNDVCRRSSPAPLLIMHGTGDDAVRYEGVSIPNPQGGEPLRITLSVMETVSFFVRRNNCSFAGAQTQYPERGRSPGTHVIRFEPRDCAAPLSFYLINGGGHTWPGEEQLPVDSFGPTNMDIRASEVIWDFFSRQTLPDTPR